MFFITLIVKGLITTNIAFYFEIDSLEKKHTTVAFEGKAVYWYRQYEEIKTKNRQKQRFLSRNMVGSQVFAIFIGVK
jgi:hypothetical protein